jgi:hypothetical protein
MGAQFFSEGAFRSVGLVASGDLYVLRQRFDAPYYQRSKVEWLDGRRDSGSLID